MFLRGLSGPSQTSFLEKLPFPAFMHGQGALLSSYIFKCCDLEQLDLKQIYYRVSERSNWKVLNNNVCGLIVIYMEICTYSGHRWKGQ